MSSKSISSASTMPIIQNDGDVDEVLFGKFIIPKSSIFYQSSFNSYAFVNLRPIVPGHVLVIPRRITEKMEHLNDTGMLYKIMKE